MAWRQQAITRAKSGPDLCRRMASLSHSDLRVKPRRCHFSDDVFKFIFLCENGVVSLKCVPKVPIKTH